MDFWAVAEKYGLPIAMLMYGILALYFEWVVSGKRYREVCRQRDKLLVMVMKGQQKTRKAVNVAEALMPQGNKSDAGD